MWIGITILILGLFIYPLLFIGPAIFGKYDKDLEDVCPLIKKQNHSRYLEDGSIYFPSRRSMTLAVLSWLIVLSLFTQAVLDRRLEHVLIILIISLIILWLDSSTGYTVTSTHLLIKSTIIRAEVRLETLQKVSHSNNPISAPALSIKRMEITTTDGRLILISPVEEEFFLRILKERSPNLTINGS